MTLAEAILKTGTRTLENSVRLDTYQFITGVQIYNGRPGIIINHKAWVRVNNTEVNLEIQSQLPDPELEAALIKHKRIYLQHEKYQSAGVWGMGPYLMTKSGELEPVSMAVPDEVRGQILGTGNTLIRELTQLSNEIESIKSRIQIIIKNHVKN